MPKAKAPDFRLTVIDSWYILQAADGTRAGMQAALDKAQERIEEDLPDVEDYESDYDETESEEEEGEGDDDE
jgi:hypothetical protein